MLPKKRFLNSLISLLGGASCLWAGVVLCLNVLSAPLFFDEHQHTNCLWLVSIGRIPHTDFWSNYPALGYVFTLPFFRLLPESIYSVFALRFLALSFLMGLTGVLRFHARNLRVHWVWGVLPLAVVVLTPEVSTLVTEFRTDAYAALMAILALSIMFKEPTFLRSALSVGLSVVSLVVMPKYIYPLLLANLAYLGYGCLKLKRVKQSVVSAVTGALVALLLSHFLLSTAGTTLWEDVYWSSIIQKKYLSHSARTEIVGSTVDTVTAYFSQFWWIGLILLLGVAGWIVIEKKKRGIWLWMGGAVIAGAILSWIAGPFPARQYLVPGLFCLILFTPYIGSLLKNKTINASGALLLVVLLTQMNIQSTRETAAKLASGQAFNDFALRQEVLNLIPRTERVVGVWPSHPTLRENLTFVGFDELRGKPRGFLPVIPINSPVWNLFQPNHLAISLESSPPASIAVPSDHDYPLGWNKVLLNFVRRHADKYQLIDFKGEKIYIRKDLL